MSRVELFVDPRAARRRRSGMIISAEPATVLHKHFMLKQEGENQQSCNREFNSPDGLVL